MNSNLVYAIHTVEARVWGPYMPCNINPDHPNAPFTCAGGTRVPITTKDNERCGVFYCNRTATHAGWYPLSQRASHISAACVAAAEKTCNNSGAPTTRGP